MADVRSSHMSIHCPCWVILRCQGNLILQELKQVEACARRRGQRSMVGFERNRRQNEGEVACSVCQPQRVSLRSI